jgi:hypothetical protein
MIAVALWWGYDRSLAIKLWQLFCGEGYDNGLVIE